MTARFQTPNVSIAALGLSVLLTFCALSVLPVSILAGARADKEKRAELVKVALFPRTSAGSGGASRAPVGESGGAVRSAEKSGLSDVSAAAEIRPFAAGQNFSFAARDSGGNLDFGTDIFKPETGLENLAPALAPNFSFSNFGASGVASVAAPVGVFELDRVPRRLSDIKVEYPRELLERAVEADVRLLLTINEDGSVEVEGVESSTDERFNECAVRAAGRLRFEPPRKNGKIVRARFVLPMPFRILK